MKYVCEKNMCAGCMACMDACTQNAIKIVDNIRYYNAIIDESKCILCNSCKNVCQQLHPSKKKVPIYWKQGWCKTDDRKRSTSGGAGFSLAKTFIELGGVVCACVFDNGEFVYKFFDSLDGIDKIQGTRYVKSNPRHIYKKIKETIRNRRVLFIGLPCQVSSLSNFVGKQHRENLFLIDLICHGSPSPKILINYFVQNHVDLEEVKQIKFRQKPNNNEKYKSFTLSKVPDYYTVAFLKGVIFTENCYSCHYASWERVSDITIGDAWGSELDHNNIDLGISLILCQSKKGIELVKASGMYLCDIEKNICISKNKQLSHPFIRPSEYETFMTEYENNSDINDALVKCYPSYIRKLKVKSMLQKMRLPVGKEARYRITYL